VTTASAIAVLIGYDGTAASVDEDKRYAKTFAVSVADSNGFAVKGAVVTPEVSIPSYAKGMLQRKDDFTVIGSSRLECANEDLNKNDILDAGEDLNKDGEITPRQSLVTVTPTTGVTDTNGIAYFQVRYFKSHATWLKFKFTANVQVSTTEGTAMQEMWTGYIIGDEKLQSTPFVVSPWGATTTPGACSNLL